MPEHTTVGDIARRDLVTFAPDTQLDHAVAQLLAHGISGAPVLDDAGRLAGILTAKDCFRAALQASYYQSWSGLVRDYMSSPVQTLDAATDIVTAAERFLATNVRRFPATQDGRLIGIVTRLDVLRALNARWAGM